jgi:peptide/nickel transport system substrate-binding protein
MFSGHIMTRNLNRGIYALALVCSAALSLAGCGNSRPDPNTAVMLIESSPVNLDPRIGLDAQSERIDMLIFDSLVKKDASYEVQPWLAKSWDQPDPLTYVFHLRPGVRFHNGQPLASADVKWSIDSAHNGTIITAKSGAFASVDHVDAPDTLTCVVHLKRADPFLLWNLSDGALGIVPAGSGKSFWQRPIGSGAYKFVSQQQDKDVILERNEDSWQPRPSIQRIRFNVVPDDTTRALELQKGSADAEINALEPDTIEALRANRRLQIQSSPGTIVNYINLNLRDPYLKDVRVRQAIAYAIDRPLILSTIWRGQARIADDLLPPGHWARTDDLAHYTHDPAKANALLDGAGYRRGPDGIRFHLQMKISNSSTPTRLMCLVAQQQLRAVGIAMDVRIYEFGTFFSDITKGAFSMYALRWIGGNESPDIFRLAYASASQPPHGANRGHYVNAELDGLMADAAKTTDREKDRADYVKVQQIVAQDVPTLPLWYQDNVVVHTKRLQNIEVSPSGDYDFLKTATLTR